MRVTIWNRIMLTVVIVTGSLVGISILANAQVQRQQGQNRQPFVRDIVGTDTKAQQRQQGQNRQQQTQQQLQDQKQQQDQEQQQVQKKQQQQDQKKKQAQQQLQDQQQKQQTQQRLQDQKKQQSQQRLQDQKKQQQQSERLPQQRQQQLIKQNQQSMTQYRQHVDRQVNLAPQRIAQLQQQKRMAQYRFQQQYFDRLHQQQLALQNDRNHDYYNDPYFYTAPNYRYKRGNRYYEINQYGANLLRQAVNYGYAEGFQAGAADRKDRWRFGYQDSFAYQDANYGYNGYYVDQNAYNYYFREGFRRGYEDGYRHRYRYGRYNNGTYSILDVTLGNILRFQVFQ